MNRICVGILTFAIMLQNVCINVPTASASQNFLLGNKTNITGTSAVEPKKSIRAYQQNNDNKFEWKTLSDEEISDIERCSGSFEEVDNQIIVEADKISKEDESRIVEELDGFLVLEYSSETNANKALARYNGKSGKKASHVKKAKIFGNSKKSGEKSTTNDSEYLSWGPEAIGVDIMKKYLTEKYGSVDKMPQITVAVIDSGVDYNHNFLKDRMGKCNFDAVTEDGDAMDENGHGTHVAGIIADSTTKNVLINAYRVMDENGEGTDVNIAKGIEQAVKDKVDVINMSLGGYGESDVVNKAMDKATEAGIVIVCAAGNDARDTSFTFPGNYKKALTVSALDGPKGSESLATYSNDGFTIDIAAPGSLINSCMPGNSYQEMDGTSMATPFVAAAVALLKTVKSDASVDTLIDSIKSNARDIGDTGYDTKYGYGEVDLTNFVQNKDNAFSTWSKEPKISLSSSEYINDSDVVKVELSTDSNGAKLYYTLDGTVPTEENGILYTSAIDIDRSTQLVVVAKEEGKTLSGLVSARYYRKGSVIQSDFMCNDGWIYSYKGLQQYIDLPEKIGGENLVGIRQGTFQFNEIICEMSLPDTMEVIEDYAFNLSGLKELHIGKNLSHIGGESWYSPTIAVIFEGIGEVLDKITIDPGNDSFILENNLLMSADKKTIYYGLSDTTTKSLTIPDGVETVKYSAIDYMWNLEELNIPASVKNLSEDGLNNLPVIGNNNKIRFSVNRNNKAYSSRNGVLYNQDKTILYKYPNSLTEESFKMPDSVKEIWCYAFNAPQYLHNITISKNLERIDYFSISGVEISKLSFPASLTHIDRDGIHLNSSEEVSLYFAGDCDNFLEGQIVISNNVSCKMYKYDKAKDFAFEWPENVKIMSRTDGSYVNNTASYTVPAGGKLLFNKITGTIDGYRGKMGDLVIPDKIDGVEVKQIAPYAFYDCQSLTGVKIPDSVTTLGRCCFENCAALEKAQIPGSIKFIPDRAFFDTDKLKELTLGEGIEVIGEYAFRKYSSGKYADELVLPSTLKEIRKAAFEWYSLALTSLVIPDSVAKIEEKAFQENQNLTELKIGRNTKNVGAKAFFECNLEDYVIPRNVGNVGYNAFYRVINSTVTIFGDAGKYGYLPFFNDTIVKHEEGAKGFDSRHLAIYNKETIPPVPYADIEVISNSAILVKDVDGAQYSIDNGQTWQDSPLFDGLTKGNIYKVCIRIGEEGSYQMSEAEEVTLLVDIESAVANKNDTLASVKQYLPEGYAFIDSEDTKLDTVGDKSYTIKYVAYDTEKYTSSQMEVFNREFVVNVVEEDVDILDAPKLKTVSNETKGIKLGWNSVSDIDGYKIYRASGTGGYKLLKTVNGRTVSYIDTTAKNGSKYKYVIKSYAGDSLSNYSNAKTMVRLVPVSFATAKNVSGKKISLKWGKNTKATGYYIQYSTSKTFAKSVKTKRLKGYKNISKTLTGLKKGKYYYVRIRVYKTVSGKNYYSKWSSAKKIKIRR